MANDHIEEMKQMFKSIHHFGSAIDFWSRRGRCFLGLIIYYINDEMKINSFMITLERFCGESNYTNVANKLIEIYQRFEILGKVGGATTHNGSELVAWFKHHGDAYKSYDKYICNENGLENEMEYELENGLESEIDNDDMDDTQEHDIVPLPDERLSEEDFNFNLFMDTHLNGNNGINDDFNRIEADFLHNDNDEDEAELILPIRIKCAAHGLNDVCKVDAQNAMIDKKVFFSFASATSNTLVGYF